MGKYADVVVLGVAFSLGCCWVWCSCGLVRGLLLVWGLWDGGMKDVSGEGCVDVVVGVVRVR